MQSRTDCYQSSPTKHAQLGRNSMREVAYLHKKPPERTKDCFAIDASLRQVNDCSRLSAMLFIARNPIALTRC